MDSRFSLTALLAAALCVAPFTAQAQDAGLMQNAINLPAVDQWNVSGASDKKIVKDAGVNGGWAYLITSPGLSANPWDIQAGVPTTKAIKTGDVVLVAFWARAVTPPTGSNAVQINAGFQEGHAPYTAIFHQPVTVSGGWKLYYASGTSPFDLTPGDGGANLQLATGAQTIALGPVFILDFGPGYDLGKLPQNQP